jgi:hypothetical protein
MINFLNSNPWIVMALLSLISFPLGLLILGAFAQRTGIGRALKELLSALKSHTEAEIGIQMKISDFASAIHDLALLTRDYKESHDTRFDRIDRALSRIMAALPKRKRD